MKYLIFPTMFMCLAACQATLAEPREVDAYTWEGVQRVVAVGDVHGDYDNYIQILELAGLVNRRGKWIGGATHLVQTGDIPDRGPDTREIMAHIDKLAEQAAKDGGQVHRLIGNHEAMNVYGDLRYVTEEEFDDFAGRNSKAIRDRYFELVMADMEKRDPEGFAELPEDYRETWNEEHPVGFVEHRQAWDPAWNPEGEYTARTQQLKTAVKINDTVFVHGGISDLYADMSLAELTTQVRAGLANFDYDNPGLVADECGPLWYRGLSGQAPEASPEVLASILERLSANRIVIGHTPTPGVIWPRYDARVIQIDTGIAEHYGGRPAYLEITSEGLFAGYPEGKLALPETDEGRMAYLETLIELQPDNRGPKALKNHLTAPAEDAGDAESGAESGEEEPQGEAAEESPNPCLREPPAESAAAG